VIVDALLDFCVAVAKFMGSLLPSWSIDFLANWDLVTSNLAALNYFLPIGELFAFTLAVFMFLPALLLASGFLWFAALIRGGSSRG
jgi:hypothetical protein